MLQLSALKKGTEKLTWKFFYFLCKFRYRSGLCEQEKLAMFSCTIRFSNVKIILISLFSCETK